MNSRLRWSLHIDSYDLPDALVVSITGRLGSTTAAAFEQALVRAVSASSPRLLLDLSGVDYVSSAGLDVLAHAARRARARGGLLVVCGLQEPVRVSFEVSGSAAELEVAEDVARACERLRAATAPAAPH